MFKTSFNLKLYWLKYIIFQALRKSIIKRNCSLYDNNNKNIIYADEHYKLSRKRINELQQEKIKTNVSCVFDLIFEVSINVHFSN